MSPCRLRRGFGASADVLLDAPHSLVTQVREPRHQLPGVVNEDGWGVAWWDDTGHLRQHRSTAALADDDDGQSLLRETVAHAFVAAVRRATPGLALDTTGNAPFVDDGWAFSLNGYVGGWVSGAHGALVRAVSPSRRARLRGDTDSESLFALVLDRLDTGDAPEEALASTVDAALAARAEDPRPSKLNLLLSDGESIWATRNGNSLFARDGAVASEPWDDDPAWREVADGSQVVRVGLH